MRLQLKENSCPAGELDVTDPYDDSIVAKVETAGMQHVQQSLDTALHLFRNRNTWLSTAERIGVLERAARIMLREKHSLTMTATREGGKPLLDSQLEVETAIDSVRLCIEQLRAAATDVAPLKRSMASVKRAALTRMAPLGVAVAVSTFSDPLNLMVQQVAAAVAAGCPVIASPTSDAPLTCLRFADILRRAGLPVEWCQVIVTVDMAVAESLIADPRIAFLSFAGQSELVWRLRSRLFSATRCALEHCAAMPVILMRDADDEPAVTSICRGGFYHAGQALVSGQRIFVPRPRAHEFGALLAARAAALTVGDPKKIDTHVGPLIRNANVRRIHAWVRDAIAGGAKLLTGGAPVGASIYQPTVLLDLPLDGKEGREQFPGPILCICAYDTIDDVIERVNIVPFSFDAAVYTQSIDSALRFFERVDASLVRVNDRSTFCSSEVAMAGARQSRYGSIGFPYTIDQMQISKALVLNSPEL